MNSHVNHKLKTQVIELWCIRDGVGKYVAKYDKKLNRHFCDSYLRNAMEFEYERDAVGYILTHFASTNFYFKVEKFYKTVKYEEKI